MIRFAVPAPPTSSSSARSSSEKRAGVVGVGVVRDVAAVALLDVPAPDRPEAQGDQGRLGRGLDLAVEGAAVLGLGLQLRVREQGQGEDVGLLLLRRRGVEDLARGGHELLARGVGRLVAGELEVRIDQLADPVLHVHGEVEVRHDAAEDPAQRCRAADPVGVRLRGLHRDQPAEAVTPRVDPLGLAHGLGEELVQVGVGLHPVGDRPAVARPARPGQRVALAQQVAGQGHPAVAVPGRGLGLGRHRRVVRRHRDRAAVPVGVQQQRAVPRLGQQDPVLGPVDLALARLAAVGEGDRGGLGERSRGAGRRRRRALTGSEIPEHPTSSAQAAATTVSRFQSPVTGGFSQRCARRAQPDPGAAQSNASRRSSKVASSSGKSSSTRAARVRTITPTRPTASA